MSSSGNGAPAAAGWSYRPGEHWAVAGRGTAALLLGSGGAGLAQRIWALLRDDEGDVDRIAEELTRDGLSHLPSFVVVQRSGDAVRTLIRGTAGLRLHLGGDPSPRALDALGYRSWREEVVPGVRGFALCDREGVAADGALLLPLLGGIVPAAELHLAIGGPGGEAVPTATGHPAPASPPVPLPAPPPPRAPAPPATGAVGDPAATLDEAAFLPDDGADDIPPAADIPPAGDIPPAADIPPPASAPPAPPAHGTGTGTVEQGGAEDDYVAWVAGDTRLGSVEDAAVRSALDEPDLPGPSVTGGAHRSREPEPPAPPPGAPEPEVPLAAPPTGARPAVPAAVGSAPPGLISSVPFATARSAPAPTREAPPAAVPDPLGGGEFDSTVIRLPGTPEGEAVSGGRAGWLPAVLCSRGHANPPESERCRVCDVDLADGEQRWVERPVVGRLRFSGPPGVLPVTGPMVIGRAPRVDRVSGDAVPEMVTVPSGDGDVSRSHLRVEVEGWQVLVVDLHATNGTVVVDPGGEGRRLHLGEERLIVPGTRVLLSDDVQFVFEAGTDEGAQ